MPKPRLNIHTDKENKQGVCPISVLYAVGNKKFSAPTGKSVAVKHWNANSPDAPIRESYFDHIALNMQLRALLTKMNRIVDEYYLKHNSFPDTEYVKAKWNEKQISQSELLLHLYGLFQRRTTDKGAKDLATTTGAKEQVVIDRLKEFAAHKGVQLTFDAINKQFIDGFNEYLTKQHNNNPNTRGARFNVLRTFIRWCQKWHNIDFSEAVISAMPCVKEVRWKAGLELDEIIRIYHLDLSHNPRMEAVRDLFLIQFGLGMRVSDLLLFDIKRVYKDGDSYFYRFTDKKTRGNQDVPIADFVYQLIQKRFSSDDRKWMPLEQTMNIHLKTICSLAGVNEIVTVLEMVEGEEVEKQVPKWACIGTHSARVSFINEMIRQGVPIATLSSWTGQSIKTIFGYMHTSKKDVAKAKDNFNERFSRGAMKAV